MIEHKERINLTAIKKLISDYCVANKLDWMVIPENSQFHIKESIEISSYKDGERSSFTFIFDEQNIEFKLEGTESHTFEKSLARLIEQIKEIAKPSFIEGLFIESLDTINSRHQFNSTVQKGSDIISLKYSYNEANFIITIQIGESRVSISLQELEDEPLDFDLRDRINRDLKDVEIVINNNFPS